MNKALATTLACAALSVAAVPALAQEATASGQVAQAARAERAKTLPSERVEARLTKLKEALKITDAQTPQWNAFADTLRKQARAGDERFKQRRAMAAKGQKREPLNAIQRLEQRQKFMAAASTRMDELLASARPLYAALSPDQQKVADEMLARQGRRGGGAHGQPGRSRS